MKEQHEQVDRGVNENRAFRRRCAGHSGGTAVYVMEPRAVEPGQAKGLQNSPQAESDPEMCLTQSPK